MKGRESDWQFDSRPLKVGNQPDSLACRQNATYRWKALYDEYNFASDFIAIRGLHSKLWAPKITRVPCVGILGLPFGSLETKFHLDEGLVERQKKYYKGESVGIPQVACGLS
jgi:hypothetical protein